MKVQITYYNLTVTLNLLGGSSVTERVLNVTAVITHFYIKKNVAQSECHYVSCSRCFQNENHQRFGLTF